MGDDSPHGGRQTFVHRTDADAPLLAHSMRRFRLYRRERVRGTRVAFVAMARHRPRRTRGASILDVLIATTIMATLAGIGLPRLSRLRDPYAVRSASQQLAASLRSARQQAIARNTSYRVVFNTTARTYTVERVNGASWVQAEAPQTLKKGVSFGTIQGGTPTFSSTGMLAAAVSVPIRGTTAHTKTVTINVLGETSIN